MIRARNIDTPFTVTAYVPDPGGAGTSKTNHVVFKAPFTCEITDIRVVPVSAWVAAAAANDGAVVAKRNNTGTALGTLAVVTNLAAASDNALAATLNAGTKLLALGDLLTVDITANGTANAPDHQIIVKYKPQREAAQ